MYNRNTIQYDILFSVYNSRLYTTCNTSLEDVTRSRCINNNKHARQRQSTPCRRYSTWKLHPHQRCLKTDLTINTNLYMYAINISKQSMFNVSDSIQLANHRHIQNVVWQQQHNQTHKLQQLELGLSLSWYIYIYIYIDIFSRNRFPIVIITLVVSMSTVYRLTYVNANEPIPISYA